MANPEASAPQVHDFKEAIKDVYRVQIGDNVTGFPSIGDLDTFTGFFITARVFRAQGKDLIGAYDQNLYTSRPKLANNGKRYPAYWDQRSRLPSETLPPTKPRFNGTFNDIHLTFVDQKQGSDVSTSEAEAYQVILLLVASLRSTGRGVIGTAARLVTATERWNGYYYSRSVDYSKLETDTVEQARQALIESQANGRAIAMRGLRNVILAGLPGSGKNS